MTTVLILGGGVMQMPAVRIAKVKGWRVVLADANPDAIAREACDYFHLVDLKDKEGIADLAVGLKGGLGLDGIFTAGTDFSSTVAWACEKLGLPGIRNECNGQVPDEDRIR
jgi:threonine dehydrogenase-like Zn-dependent dehydrogenase